MSDDASSTIAAGNAHQFRVAAIPVHVLEVHDVHFHFDSAVLLPNQAAPAHGHADGDGSDDDTPKHTTAFAVLAETYHFVGCHADKQLLIPGHTDTVGSKSYNVKLSELRSEGVLAALTGDRDRWVEIADEKHEVEDYQEILHWAAIDRGWPCEPGPVDNVAGPQTKAAVECFQERYNADFDQSIAVDGIVGKQTWGAVFDLYMEELKEVMETDDAGLESARGSLQFIDDGHKFVGCGEHFPLEAKGRDNYKSATNRRVEILFFDPGHEIPPLDCHQGSGCVPSQCKIYETNKYRFVPVDAVPVVVPAKLRLTSPGIDDRRKLSHGAPVALNDDHDNGRFHPAGAGGGNRELEPIFDLDFLGNTPNEDDLLEINLELQPADHGGKIELEAVEADAGDRIRVWPRSTKGPEADIVELPLELGAGDLPKQLWVEGIGTGSVTLKATLTSACGTATDQLKINVLELVEQQGGTRRIVYDYHTPIDFEVVGAPDNYECEWDLDGDGTFGSATAEQGKTGRQISVGYGPTASADRIQLVENASNTRHIVDVRVRVTGGLVLRVKGETTFGGSTVRGMRVALNSNHGQPLPAASNAGLQGLFAWSDTVPVTFSNATAAELTNHQTNDGVPNAFQGADRIQFGSLLTNSNAVTPRPGVGNNRRVYGVIVGQPIFTSGQVREDLNATVNHEIQHLQQHVQVRDSSPANNVWRLLDDFFGGANGYSNTREADGHFTELLDSNVSWRHHLPAVQNDLRAFRSRFTRSINNDLAALPAGGARSALRSLLQSHYGAIPFFEMKRPGYDHFVRPPV